jgi:hypothetical protein
MKAIREDPQRHAEGAGERVYCTPRGTFGPSGTTNSLMIQMVTGLAVRLTVAPAEPDIAAKQQPELGVKRSGEQG